MEIKNKQSILKLPLLLLIGVVLFSFGVNAATAASVPTDNSTIYVNNTQGNDTWDGQSATYNGTSGPKKTISNATCTVTTNGTIYIASGRYNESKIKITTNMTIIGENQLNTIIDALGNGDIFDITPGTSLTLINLTLENANNSITSGGAINDDNGIGVYSDLNITDCTFTNNNADNWGGAIYAYDVNLNINKCIFTQNIAYSNGGALSYSDDGTGTVSMTINSSNFTNNNAMHGDGGAIYNTGTSSETNNTFNNNTATYGGAICNKYDGILTETNDIFTNNTATYCGGAIYNTGILTENNNTFNNNTVTNYGGAILNTGILSGTNNTFNNNTATYCAGAIDNQYHGILTETNDIFTNNTATYGGAIFNEYYGILTETNDIFTNNTAILGGAIYNEGTVNVNFCWIIGNNAIQGTQIYNNYGTIDATDNWWGTNTPNTSGIDIVNSGDTCDYGPWIVLRINSSSPVQSGDPLKITADLTHDSNSNDTSGNGVIPDGVLIQFYDTLGNIIGTGTTSNGKKEINYTPNNYSGIVTINATANNVNVSTNIAVTNLNIYISTTGNDITGDGSQGNPYQSITQGISYVSREGTLHIANGTYTANNIQINNDITITGQNQQNTIINGNNSGNIFVIVNGISVKINNLTLTNGTGNKGGAIYNQGNLTINNANLAYNFAYNGGAIYNEYDGILTEINDTFTNNTSKYFGGAIFNMNVVTETNNTFNNNKADYNGGAIYNAGTFTVGNSTFKDNNAQSGGAIYNNNNLTITNSTLSNNTALNGGAFYNYDATLNVICNTITNNTAAGNGSAIYNCNDGRAGIVNSVVEFNRIIGNINSNSEIYSTDDSVNANLNWWGSNSSPSSYVNSDVNITSWLVLSAKANPISLPNNSNTTINVDLQHDNMGNWESSSIPDGVLVNYMPTLGSMPISSIIVGGITQSSLYSGVMAGVDTVSVIVDNQLVKTVVTIKDTIPPTVDITSPANKTYVHGTVPINVTATDNVGVTKVVFTINGNSYTDTNGTDGWSYNWNTMSLNGVYNITATAYDAANNTQSQTIVVNVDNTIPTVSVNIKGGLYKSNQTITLKINEAGNIYYTLNGTTPTSKSTLYTKPIIISSTSTLKYIAIDTASKISSTYVQNYVIDKTAPKVVSTIPANNAKGISLTSLVTIKFSEKINKGTKFSKIYIKNMTTGKITHTTITLSGNIMKIKMTRSRLSLNNYQVYIPTSAVKDVAGNNNSQYVVKFKTSRY